MDEHTSTSRAAPVDPHATARAFAEARARIEGADVLFHASDARGDAVHLLLEGLHALRALAATGAGRGDAASDVELDALLRRLSECPRDPGYVGPAHADDFRRAVVLGHTLVDQLVDAERTSIARRIASVVRGLHRLLAVVLPLAFASFGFASPRPVAAEVRRSLLREGAVERGALHVVDGDPETSFRPFPREPFTLALEAPTYVREVRLLHARAEGAPRAGELVLDATFLRGGVPVHHMEFVFVLATEEPQWLRMPVDVRDCDGLRLFDTRRPPDGAALAEIVFVGR